MTIKFKDTIRAKPNTVAEIFAEGREGVVASINERGTRGLVRWGGPEDILMGFRPEEVEVVEGD